MSSGLSHSVQELMMRRDMAMMSVCAVCNRLSMLCDCEVDLHKTRVALIPHSTVCFDIINAVTLSRSFEYLTDHV